MLVDVLKPLAGWEDFSLLSASAQAMLVWTSVTVKNGALLFVCLFVLIAVHYCNSEFGVLVFWSLLTSLVSLQLLLILSIHSPVIAVVLLSNLGLRDALCLLMSGPVFLDLSMKHLESFRSIIQRVFCVDACSRFMFLLSFLTTTIYIVTSPTERER